jgi:murein DD-endopeptidase MepM/ murein hydrolase activator NlpD
MVIQRRAAIAAAVLTAVGMAGCSAGSNAPSASTLGVASQPSAPAPTPSPAASSSAASSAHHLSPVPTAEVFVFPVVGHYSYAHVHHDYPATDIIAACGSKVVAATNGTILEVTRVDKWKASVDAGATRGGLSVSIRGDDGVRYYGSHFEEINTNIQPGVRVTAGEMLGKVGETGDASACHLHFGLSPVCSGVGDWWNQRGVIWPWPYLDSWRAGGHKSPAAAIVAWQRQNGCPTKPTVDP